MQYLLGKRRIKNLYERIKTTSSVRKWEIALTILLIAIIAAVIFIAIDNPNTIHDINGKIVFSSSSMIDQEIYLMTDNNSNITNLTNTSGSNAVPTWSSDGTKIAFSSHRDGNWEVYVMNADGSNQTNLTNSSADDIDPWWSPD